MVMVGLPLPLRRVTGALPDSGVVTSLAWSANGIGVLVGSARRATDVLARLDRLPVLSDVRDCQELVE